MMNHLLLGDRLGMIVLSVVLPLVIIFVLALLAARQYSHIERGTARKRRRDDTTAPESMREPRPCSQAGYGPA